MSHKSINSLCSRCNIPHDFVRVAKISKIIYDSHLDLVMMFEKTDAFRQPQMFRLALNAVCMVAADISHDKIEKILLKCLDINGREFVNAGFVGKDIGVKILDTRIKIIEKEMGLVI